MNKISKSYLKSFIKDIFILTLMVLYLIIMFIVIFILSNTSLQINQQYNEIQSKSKEWKSSYHDNSTQIWNITYIGKNFPTSNSYNNDNNFFNVLEKITDEKGQKLLLDDSNSVWYKTIYEDQLGGVWSPEKDYIDLSNNESDINTNSFTNYLNNDISIMSQVGSDSNWKNFKVPNRVSEIKNTVSLGKIFNPKADWSNINYSFYKALYEQLSDNKYYHVNESNILGFNQKILISNYISKVSLVNKKINNNNNQLNQNLGSSNNSIAKIKQRLSINFTDNKYRKGMSQVFLQKNKGSMPKNDQEILVNKQFADNNHFKIGDHIKLLGNNNVLNQINTSGKELINTNFKIVGYGMSLSSSVTEGFNATPDDSIEDKLLFENKNIDFGNIYVTYSEYNKIKNILSQENEDENESVFNNWWQSTDPGVLNPILKFSNQFFSTSLLSNNSKQYDNFYNIVFDHHYLDTNSITYVTRNWINSGINSNIISNKTNIIVNLVMIFFILGFSFIFLNLIIKRDIDKSKRQLGIFKMLGYKTSELSLIYSYKVLITFFIASIIGYLISIPIQIYSSNYMFKNNIVILTITRFNYMPSLLFFAFIFIPILFTTVSFLINLRYIKLSPLKLISDNIRIKNVKILKLSKKFTVRKNSNLRLKKAFTIQNLWKWVSISTILSFSLLALILNASSNIALDNYLKNSVISVFNRNTKSNYSPNILTDKNTIIDNDKIFQTKNYDSTNNPFLINDSNNPDLQTKINVSLDKWHNSIDNDGWININIKEDPYVHISDLQKIIDKFQKNIFLNSNNSVNQDFMLALFNLKYLYYNSSCDTIVCLNNVTQNNENNFYSMQNWINSLDISKKITKKIVIYGLDDRNNYDKFKEFYNKKNQMNEDQYNSVMKYSEDRTIPIVISKKLSEIMNWKINDLVKSTDTHSNIGLNFYENSSDNDEVKWINLKIVGITNDVYTTDIYTGYKNLAKFYIDKDKVSYSNGKINGTNYGLLNNWLSNVNIYPNFKNLDNIKNSWTNFESFLQGNEPTPKKTSDLNLDYYYTANNNDLDNINNGDITAGQYFQDWKTNGNNDYLNIPNVINFSQIDESISSVSKTLTVVSNIQTIFILFLVCILIIILISIIVDENKQTIVLLKVIGYKNKNINYITTSNIIFIMISSFIIGIIFSKISLYFISNYVKIKYNFFIDLPLSLSKIIEIGILITIVFLLIWIITLNKIKKNRIEELGKLD